MTASPPDRPLWEEHLHGGAHWSGVARRGMTLRLTDMEGGANVAALCSINYEERLERYNMADTLKAQHTAYPHARGACVTPTWDAFCARSPRTPAVGTTRFCGVSNAAMVDSEYGKTRFQEQRNDSFKNGYESLLNELGKYGLGKRDMVANVNFFSKVVTDDGGDLHFVPHHSRAGNYIDLRFEMNDAGGAGNMPASARSVTRISPALGEVAASVAPAADD